MESMSEQSMTSESNALVSFDLKSLENLTIVDSSDMQSVKSCETNGTEGESDDSSLAGVHFSHLATKSPDSFRPILKRVGSHEQFVIVRRNSWKVLPPPDPNNLRIVRKTSVVSDCGPTTDPESLPPKPPKRHNSVSFHEVNLRYYNQCLGDHPSTSYGPPISLDWDFAEAEPIAVDDYEVNRGPRRTLRQLMLNYYARKNILTWVYGYSDEEVKKATRASNRVAFQRGITKCLLPISKVEDLVESATRKTKRLMVARGKMK
jgi:hypothetical protein